MVHANPRLRLPRLTSNHSRWLREDGSWPGWQQGYGAFSVSPSNVDAVRHYIQNQPEHHRRYSFEEEFLAMLAKSGIAFNKAEVGGGVPTLKPDLAKPRVSRSSLFC